MVGSSGRQRVPSDAVGAFALPLPAKSVLRAFGNYCSDLLGKIRENENQSSVLAKIRDTLLPKLISGELRIPEAERLLAEAGV